MIKEWKDVVGYEGLYQVSNFGDVISLPRNGTVKYIKEKAQQTDKDGYKIVKLRKNNHPKMVKVHRLVALAFIEKECGKDIVDHINRIKHDNRVNNLRWVTNRENVMFGKLSRPAIKVTQIKNCEIINVFDSLNSAELLTGFSRYKITKNSIPGFKFVLESSTTRE